MSNAFRFSTRRPPLPRRAHAALMIVAALVSSGMQVLLPRLTQLPTGQVALPTLLTLRLGTILLLAVPPCALGIYLLQRRSTAVAWIAFALVLLGEKGLPV